MKHRNLFANVLPHSLYLIEFYSYNRRERKKNQIKIEKLSVSSDNYTHKIVKTSKEVQINDVKMY